MMSGGGAGGGQADSKEVKEDKVVNSPKLMQFHSTLSDILKSEKV